MKSKFLFDVFLSHNTKDKPRVRKLATHLRKSGLRVWFDEWAVEYGEDIYLAIERGLQHSRSLVLCMTPNAFGSHWVTMERSTGMFRDPMNRSRRFIPLLLADCSIPEILRRLKYIDLRKESPTQFDALLRACNAGRRAKNPLTTSANSKAVNSLPSDRPSPERRQKSSATGILGDLVAHTLRRMVTIRFDHKSRTLHDSPLDPDHSLVDAVVRNPQQRFAFERICSQMHNAGGSWVLVESNVQLAPYFQKLYPPAVRELKDLRSYFEVCTLSVTQISFFDANTPPFVTKCRDIDKLMRKSSVLGTCVMIHVTGRPNRYAKGLPKNKVISDYVLEAAISTPSHAYKSETGTRFRAPIVGFHVRICSLAEVIVFGKKLSIPNAGYFCQQNHISTSCAHTAIKMSQWHIKPCTYQLSTHLMNEIVANFRKHSFFPGEGLALSEMALISKRLGLNLMTTEFNRNQHRDISAYELAHLFVESGFPTFIVFHTQTLRRRYYHMVPVIGHIVSTDEWLPAALRTYHHMPKDGLIAPKELCLSSVEWISDLIIHDDLLGPYMRIGPNSLAWKSPDNFGREVSQVMAMVPKQYGTDWSPLLAQLSGIVQFRHQFKLAAGKMRSNDHFQRLRDRWSNPGVAARDMIARTELLRAPGAYVEQLEAKNLLLKNNRQLSSALKSELNKHEAVWLVELSMPDLDGRGRAKLGEVVLPFDAASSRISKHLKHDQVPVPISVKILDDLKVYRDAWSCIEGKLSFEE